MNNTLTTKKKSAKINYIYNLSYQILTIIVPLITAPYIARILGPTNSGIHSYTYSITYYFVVFTMLGINSYGNRLIAKNRSTPKKLNEAFSSLLYAHLLIAIPVIITFVIYNSLFTGEYQKYFWLQSLYILATVFDINWLFYGLEEFKIPVIRNIIIKLLTTASIFIFVHNPNDLSLYIFIISFSQLLSSISLYSFVRKTKIKLQRVSKKDIIKHIKPLFVLFLPTIALNLYRSMDKIMLEQMIDVRAVGLYEYSERIITLPITLIYSLGTVMLPKITHLIALKKDDKAKEYIDKSMEFSIFLSVAMSVGLYSVASSFIPLFLGEQYGESILLVRILSLSMPFAAISSVVQTQYLIPKERDRDYITAMLTGVIINFLLNIILIKEIGIPGACIATVVTDFHVMFYQLIKIKNELKIGRYIHMFIKYAIYGIIMLITIELIDLANLNAIITMIVKIIIGAIVYLSINYRYLKSIVSTTIIKKRLLRNEKCN